MLRAGGALIVVAVATLMLWLGLGREEPRADFVVASDVLRTIDPARVSWLDEIQVTNAMFEGLTRLDPVHYRPEPAVARDWRLDDTRRVYTFHLRPTARWSDGRPVTAGDFRFAWLRVLNPKVQSQYAFLLFVIAGAEDYYRSRLNDNPADDLPAGAVGICAVDPATLRVRLRRPCSYFLDITSFPTLAPVPPETLRRWAYRDGRVLRRTQHLWTRPANIVCNGAFTLARWDFKRRLLLEPNPCYWDADHIAIRSLEIFTTADPGVGLLAYETGRIDLVMGLDPEVARVLYHEQQAGRRPDFHLSDRFATYFFRINCRRPPLDNPDLRKALALAIDKAAICKQVLGLGQTPADTYVPRGALEQMARRGSDGRVLAYEPPEGLGAGLSYDQRVALARQYLRRSGYDQTRGDRALELSYAPDPPRQRRISEAVQAMWETALGIRVDLRVQERKVLSARIRNLDYDIVRSDWYGDYMDPATFLDMFTTGNGQNRTGWSNAEYDRLIAAAALEGDDARRFALFRQAERILCEEELPIIPLFFKTGNFLLRSRFCGLHDNLRDVLPIHRVQICGGARVAGASGTADGDGS